MPEPTEQCWTHVTCPCRVNRLNELESEVARLREALEAAREALALARQHYLCGVECTRRCTAITRALALSGAALGEGVPVTPRATNADRPKRRSVKGDRWSRKYDACRECGRTELPHAADGYCRPCYWQQRRSGKGQVPA